MSTITIIMPIYNAEKYLNKCIESIFKQSFWDWSLVCVNDGSTDGSLKILKKWTAKDSRIKCIDQKNQGSVAARKNGVFCEHTKCSKYLMFCDSDDILPPNALQILFDTAEENLADIVCGETKRILKGIVLPDRFVPPCFSITSSTNYDKTGIQDKLLISYYGISDFPVSLWSKLFRTELIQQAMSIENTVRFLGDDLWVSLQTMIHAEKLTIVPDVVYHYRVGGGTSKFMSYYLSDFIKLYNYKYRIAEEQKMPQDWRMFINYELMNISKCHIQQCIRLGHFKDEELLNEVIGMCDCPEIIEAARYLSISTKNNNSYAGWVLQKDYEKIITFNKDIIEKNRIKQRLKDGILRLL